jgi:ATP-dependent helicase HrpA
MGRTVLAFPGLKAGPNAVSVVLFTDRTEAEAASREGVRRLAELSLPKDLAWLQRELRQLTAAPPPSRKAASLHDALSAVSARMAAAGASGLPSPEELQQHAAEHILRHSLRLEPILPLGKARFAALLEQARRDWPLLVRKVIETTRAVFAKRTALLAESASLPSMEAELRRLIPADFPAGIPHARLDHLPRYLEALAVRARKAKLQPAKDKERAALLAPYDNWIPRVDPAQHESFRWLLEEYRVSLFAQELGTAEPVSPKRLDAFLLPAP